MITVEFDSNGFVEISRDYSKSLGLDDIEIGDYEEGSGASAKGIGSNTLKPIAEAAGARLVQDQRLTDLEYKHNELAERAKSDPRNIDLQQEIVSSRAVIESTVTIME